MIGGAMLALGAGVIAFATLRFVSTRTRIGDEQIHRAGATWPELTLGVALSVIGIVMLLYLLRL